MVKGVIRPRVGLRCWISSPLEGGESAAVKKVFVTQLAWMPVVFRFVDRRESGDEWLGLNNISGGAVQLATNTR